MKSTKSARNSDLSCVVIIVLIAIFIGLPKWISVSQEKKEHEEAVKEAYASGYSDGYDEGYYEGAEKYDIGYENGQAEVNYIKLLDAIRSVHAYTLNELYESGEITAQTHDFLIDAFGEKVGCFYHGDNLSFGNALDSTAVSKIGFAGHDVGILFVEYETNGYLYAYYDVPRTLYEDFCYAESMGAYVNEYIKPYYDYERLG